VKAASDHIEIYPLPENPVEYFCGIFEEGSSLTHALLKDRKEEAERERKRVLDSYALLAYLKKEDKYEKVKTLLGSKGAVLLMNEINLGECFYILARQRGWTGGVFRSNHPSQPAIIKRSNTFRDVIEAAKIKAAHALSYADCFAVQTAGKKTPPSLPGTRSSKKRKSW